MRSCLGVMPWICGHTALSSLSGYPEEGTGIAALQFHSNSASCLPWKMLAEGFFFTAILDSGKNRFAAREFSAKVCVCVCVGGGRKL